jgi:hypothetical protein
MAKSTEDKYKPQRLYRHEELNWSFGQDSVKLGTLAEDVAEAIAKYGAHTHVEIETDTDYDSSHVDVSIQVLIDRMETAEEVELRRARDQDIERRMRIDKVKNAQLTKAREQKELARLMKKYNVKSAADFLQNQNECEEEKETQD